MKISWDFSHTILILAGAVLFFYAVILFSWRDTLSLPPDYGEFMITSIFIALGILMMSIGVYQIARK
jgi:hypothetical protein